MKWLQCKLILCYFISFNFQNIHKKNFKVDSPYWKGIWWLSPITHLFRCPPRSSREFKISGEHQKLIPEQLFPQFLFFCEVLTKCRSLISHQENKMQHLSLKWILSFALSGSELDRCQRFLLKTVLFFVCAFLCLLSIEKMVGASLTEGKARCDVISSIHHEIWRGKITEDFFPLPLTFPIW